MARNPVAPAVCTVCGTKFNAERDRCPRCRTKIELLDRETLVAAARAAAARSRRMQVIGLSALTVALAGGAAVWVFGSTRQPDIVRPATVDPLGARRTASPPSKPADGGAPSVAKERAFMDAPAVASEAYRGGDFGSALAHYEEAIEKNPRDAESLNNLGQLLVRQGHIDQSLEYFNRAIELNPDRWSYVFNRAHAYAELSRWTESIADYRRAEQLFPTDYVTAFNLAMALHKSGDDEAAVPEYQRAIGMAPDDPSFRMALAISLERLNRKADAAAAYGEALRLNPTAPDADKVKERIALLTGAPAAAAAAPKLLD